MNFVFYRKNVSLLAFDSATMNYVTVETKTGTVLIEIFRH